MATITSNASGAWATGATWVGGVKPADGDAVVIAAGHSILMDEDQSAMTGMLSVTIQGHATTPGMLYFKDGTSGYLKIRTANNLVGTSGTLKGRLLANSDGVWGNTGALAFADKAVIDLGATSFINAQYLDIALYCAQPTNKSVRTYGTKYDFTASGSTVDVDNDTIDLGTPPPSAGTPVMITTAAGVLPTGLLENHVYYVRAVSGNTCKLAKQNSDATIVDITGTGSGSCSLFTGHTDTGTATMNVLDDVTSDTPWVTTDGHDRVVLSDDAAPDNFDQQRVQLTTINAGSIVLSANVDSAQYPGARIWLISRNVSIRSVCTTAINIVNYDAVPTAGGVFQCEINSIAGTGTTFYGIGIKNGTGHTVSGTISGCSSGTQSGIGFTISGIIAAFTQGVNGGTSYTISGSISGGTYGVFNGSGHTISGTISGCTNGLYGGVDLRISGAIFGCNIGIHTGIGHTVSGTISGCVNGFYQGTGHTISGTISGGGTGVNTGHGFTISGIVSGCGSYVVFIGSASASFILRGAATKEAPPTFTTSRNPTTGGGVYAGTIGVYCEDYGGVLGASYALLMWGDVIKNTTTVRSGGAASSLEVVPLSNCSVIAPIPIFEWTELAVPASAQNKSVYMRADAAWSVYPTADELYVEAEYISDGTTFAVAIVKSTAVLNHASNWIQFTIPEFTPAVAGSVRYRAYLKKYEADRKVYVDNMLVAA